MKIVRVKDKKFGNDFATITVTGYALYEEGKGFYAFTADRDKYGILTPYMPCGGRNALQAIIDAGGFDGMDGMEFVNTIN